ncbi:MAG: Ig-like domain-containing protein, partial [Acidimicrobiales bacterium]
PPLQSFEGVSNQDNEAVHGFPFLPPDPTGEAGPNHYVQAVNRSIGVFSKTGVMAPGFPKRLRDVWAGFGGVCETQTRGDPILLYDQLADRWTVSQFAEENGFRGPFFQCIAVSATGDPTGSYHRYAFFYDDTEINEYPKLAVWPDAYYMSVDEFTGSLANSTGTGLVAFERDKMLAGLPAAQVQFEIPPHLFSLLPSDVDGSTLPPPGSPNYFVSLEQGPADGPASLEVWKFHVDFANPGASTLTGPVALPIPQFQQVCGYLESCIPQPNTLARLHSFSHTVMFRAAYRNFGTHESIVFNHTVDVNGADHAGVRFYEVRGLGAAVPVVAQQGTYAPDGDNRWMGSVAMDRVGNLAVGYSVASAQTFPSVRYTGRLASDPPDALTRSEQSLVEGSGSQTAEPGRWGDYSHMSVDPVDDCTFWYTHEYYARTSQLGWRTRIGSFVFPGCRGPRTTATTVTASPNPSDFGDPATFVATVGPSAPGDGPVPTGQVVFSVDGRDVATVPLDGAGQATYASAVLQPGNHSVTARYLGDAEHLASANGQAVTQRVTCTNNLTGRVQGPLVMTPGSWCLRRAIVSGDVTVHPGAAVSLSQTSVAGGIVTDGAKAIGLCSVVVRGTVTIRNSAGFVLVGDHEQGCTGNVITGDLLLEGNIGGFAVGHNATGGLAARTNAGGGPLPESSRAEIAGNRIRGDLSCTGNVPPPTNDGRPNVVTGARRGQCSSPGF